MKAHYYRLEGNSLEALDGLIEYDRQENDKRTAGMREAINKLLREQGMSPTEEPQPTVLTPLFSAALVKGWQKRLGFENPAVQVRAYAKGDLIRAYHVFPRIAMNPGTSKANFGMVDLFKDPQNDAGRKRIAIYTSFEDYKGQHFAPPGAVKLTDAEFATYDAVEDSFEYYRTYDEGIATPQDFDPQAHIFVPYHDDVMRFSHAFLVQGEAQKAMIAYDKAKNDWFMSYQDFRDKTMQDYVLPMVLGDSRNRLTIMVHDGATPDEPRCIEMTTSNKNWESIRDQIEMHFTVLSESVNKTDTSKIRVIPRDDTDIGQYTAMKLAEVMDYPRPPVDFGFKVRPTLENSIKLTPEITGFPYMQIERHDGDKFLVFRLPPFVKGMAAPQDCAAVSLDEYKALGAPEQAPNRDGWPTHIFRIGGALRADIDAFDAVMDERWERMAKLHAEIEAEWGAIAPGFKTIEFQMPYYLDSNRPHYLDMRIRSAAYEQLKPMLEQAFYPGSHAGGINSAYGDEGQFRHLWLVPRDDTPEGQAWKARIAAVPYEPNMPTSMWRDLGFSQNKGYDLMMIDSLSGLDQKAVILHFPSYINDVEAPEHCVPLTKKEYAFMLAESADVRAGSPPPPRPPEMMHLPLPQGIKSYEHLMNLKRSKDREGLPLHQKSEFSWFKIKLPDGPQ